MRSITHLAAALALAAIVPAFASSAHDHERHAQDKPRITLDHGRKWATDAPLRNGMDAIRSELADKLPAIREGSLQPAASRALGASVESQVGYIVANCKLPEQADANLHVIVAELVQAADGLKAAGDGKQARSAAMRAVKAVNMYGRYFDHPQWRPLAPRA